MFRRSYKVEHPRDASGKPSQSNDTDDVPDVEFAWSERYRQISLVH